MMWLYYITLIIFFSQDSIHGLWVHENTSPQSRSNGSSHLTSSFLKMFKWEGCRRLVQKLNSSPLGKGTCQKTKIPTPWLSVYWRLSSYPKTSSTDSKLCTLWNKKTWTKAEKVTKAEKGADGATQLNIYGLWVFSLAGYKHVHQPTPALGRDWATSAVSCKICF